MLIFLNISCNGNEVLYSCICAVLRNKRSEVVAELKKLQMQTDEITKIFEEVEVRSMIETAR